MDKLVLIELDRMKTLLGELERLALMLQVIRVGNGGIEENIWRIKNENA